MRPWQLYNGLCKQQCCLCPLMSIFWDVPCQYEANGGELAIRLERERPRLHDFWKLSLSRFHSDCGFPTFGSSAPTLRTTRRGCYRCFLGHDTLVASLSCRSRILIVQAPAVITSGTLAVIVTGASSG